MSSDRCINPFERDNFYKLVGESIRRARVAEGLSLSQLGKRAKLVETTIYNAEIGQTCSLLVLARIAEALDVTLDALVPTEATAALGVAS